MLGTRLLIGLLDVSCVRRWVLGLFGPELIPDEEPDSEEHVRNSRARLGSSGAGGRGGVMVRLDDEAEAHQEDHDADEGSQAAIGCLARRSLLQTFERHLDDLADRPDATQEQRQLEDDRLDVADLLRCSRFLVRAAANKYDEGHRQQLEHERELHSAASALLPGLSLLRCFGSSCHGFRPLSKELIALSMYD